MFCRNRQEVLSANFIGESDCFENALVELLHCVTRRTQEPLLRRRVTLPCGVEGGRELGVDNGPANAIEPRGLRFPGNLYWKDELRLIEDQHEPGLPQDVLNLGSHLLRPGAVINDDAESARDGTKEVTLSACRWRVHESRFSGVR